VTRAAESSEQGGVVLCRAGAHRLAFFARQVVAIELWGKGGRRVEHAREAFALPPESGRLLMAEGGFGVVVDAVEVAAEPPALMPAPLLLLGEAGGSVRGFLSMGGELWPVLRLPEFSRYLAGITAPEAA
jgi:hypothetical protein